jgi:nucleotide-binding universal stress UspA family protein
MPIRRILVALDASPASLAALDAAAELANALSVELSGLFVEEVNLLRVAALPSTRAPGSFSGRPAPLERQGVERGIRAEARRAREALAAAAERNLLRWSFRVARGMVAPEILAATSEANLVVLGRTGWSRSRMGSTARAVAMSAPGPALIVGSDARPGSSVLVLYDGSESSERAIALAADLARKRGVTVVIPAKASQDARSLIARAERRLAERGMPASLVELPSGDASTLARVANHEDAGLLLVPRDAPAGEDAALAGLVEEIECPVLLVR